MASTTNTNIAQFSADGVEIFRDNKVLTYLYGLSDFWATMFSDIDKVNTVMGATSLTAAETYNKFLQLSAGIALEDLEHVTGSQIRLEFIRTEDAVSGEVETYKLQTKIASCKFIVNRPFLPTSTLEHNVDFFIDEEMGTISFAKHISDYFFPFKLNSDGSKEFSVWMVDAREDSDLIYKNFAKLIGIDQPERTSENFKNLIYGLYFMYVNGPNLDLIKRGLNLALGVPLVRDSETVLEIRNYLNTDQYIVITDRNSYIVPYGLVPTVEVGQEVETGDEIASWVEVKDYVNDGEWWINYMIPSHLLPHVPDDIPDRNRYATEGSYADYLMRNYLRTHTFLVNVKTVGFKNIQTFEQLSDIIKRVKPSYTTPIYVWTVPTADEDLVLVDEDITFSKHVSRCINLTSGMYRFTRDSDDPLSRTCPQFTRFSAPEVLDSFTGNAPEINGFERNINGGFVDGYIYPQKQFREMSDSENAWMRAVCRRDSSNYLPKKSLLGFDRNIPLEVHGTGPSFMEESFPGYRVIPLYTTTMLDIMNKFDIANEQIPATYLFTLFRPINVVDGINEVALNSSKQVNFTDFMVANFDTFFKKGNNINYVGPFAAKDNYKVFTPTASDLTEEDFLAFVKIVDYMVGVFWVTKNFEIETVPYWANKGDDPLTMEVSGVLARGMGHLGSPAYVIRSAGAEIVYSQGSSINDEAINESNGLSSDVPTVTYSDAYNSSMPMDRSGRAFKFRKITR